MRCWLSIICALIASYSFAEDVFEIVPGYLPHVAYSKNRAVDFAIDKYEAGEWSVCVHYPRGTGYVAIGEVGQSVNDDLFGADAHSIDGKGDVFRVAFRWWDNSVTPTLYCYGWFTLGTSGGDLVVLAGEASESQNATVVGRGEAVVPPLEFKVDEFSDYVALASDCIPNDTAGHVTIPAAIGGKPVRVIGVSAFNGCAGITSISIPTSVVTIGHNAFLGCSALKELEIPESVTNVGDYVVSYCMALGEMRIKAALPTFGYKAFANTGMTNLVLSLGITNIDQYAFADNRKLKSVTIPLSMERIGMWSFDENCLALQSVSVPWATVVEDEAFPPGCKIVRYGPQIDAPGKPDDETKTALMRTLNWRDYATKEAVEFYPCYESYESNESVCACAHLGIAPFAIETEEDWNNIIAYYKMPSVRLLDFDHANRTLTAQVVPAQGTRIVSDPFIRAFGFNQIVHLGAKDRYEEDSDLCYVNGEEGYILDFSDYVRSNGIFRLSFPQLVYDNAKDNSGFFQIKLRDYRRNLW